MPIEQIPLNSLIRDKVAWANACFNGNKADFTDEPRIADLLGQYQAAAGATRREMREMGILTRCAKCETEEGGSCCGLGMEDRYSGTMLLINSLMGVALPLFCYDPKSCYFLGATGCTLTGKQVICVNYLCREETKRHTVATMSVLKEKEGVELDLIFTLDDQIKKKLITLAAC